MSKMSIKKPHYFILVVLNSTDASEIIFTNVENWFWSHLYLLMFVLSVCVFLFFSFSVTVHSHCGHKEKNLCVNLTQQPHFIQLVSDNITAAAVDNLMVNKLTGCRVSII